MVTPTPRGSSMEVFKHFASFLRGAESLQIEQFWIEMSQRTLAKIEASPLEKVWTSTSGKSVRWLHLRLDSKPKHYQFRPYLAEEK